MRRIEAKRLSVEGFLPYGRFAHLLQPAGPAIGDAPVTFYRDMAGAFLGSPMASFSVVVCAGLPPVVTEAEQHFHTAEGLLPLDGDALVFAAPATDRQVPYSQIEAFFVPRGTLVVFGAGVWHKAPFPVGAGALHSLVVLPERTYANDCLVVPFPEREWVEITGPECAEVP